MKSALLVAASLFAGLGACAVNVEQVKVIPQGWQKLNTAVSPSKPLRLSISLRQPNIGGLKAKMASSSDHLSLEDVRALAAPSPKDVHDVLKWLSENGLSATQQDDFIHVDTTVAKAEPLLGMKLNAYTFEGKGPVLRTTEYSVPDSVSDAITFISPLANFMTPKKEAAIMSPASITQFKAQASADNTSAACAQGVNPACLRQLYNIKYKPTTSYTPVRFAVAGFLEQYANHADLKAFLQENDSQNANHDFKVALVNNGKDLQDPQSAGVEAGLDIEYAASIGFPADITFYSTGGRGDFIDENGKNVTGAANTNEPYLEFFQYMVAQPDSDIPHVISLSYGDDELSVPKDYAKKVCDLIGLVTSRGTSVIFSSGDGGSAGGQGSNCRTNDGTNREITMPTFPASCPWVTSVGATTNTVEPPKGASFSSGGFSTYFPRESWQDSAIDAYVTELDGHLDGKFNKSMRGIPDIAAVGTMFTTIIGGRTEPVQGTSASAPLFASLIALINDARLSQGKKSLGFLNERLYSAEVQAVLQDVTTGISASCTFDGQQPGGWPAKKGWDAITGNGVPKDFVKFLNVLSK